MHAHADSQTSSDTRTSLPATDASSGESFSVSDPTEAWHVDFIGKGQGQKGAVWVAMRVPDGHIGGHANQARITTWPRDDPAAALWAPDIVDFAVAKGLYPKTADPLAFSFADTFDPLTPFSARVCEARSAPTPPPPPSPLTPSAFCASHWDKHCNVWRS